MTADRDRAVASRIRVLVACSGVGHVSRGFETASEELEQALRGSVDVTLARGGGVWRGGPGRRLFCLQRFGTVSQVLRWSGPRAYLLEQRSFAPSVYAMARLGGYPIVHLHDPGLMNALWHLRNRLGGNFAIVFTNGGPMTPEHLLRPDVIQSVTPIDADRLSGAGFPGWRVAMVPHGTRRPSASGSHTITPGPPRSLIGVGTLNDSHKGFHTAVRAVAQLPDVRLRLLGQPDHETPELQDLGRRLLGARFSTGTVPMTEIPAELAAADAFVLPTHIEGFCIAVLEAMNAGLPCLVSDIPVLRWLVGDAGVLLPPDQPQAWAAALRDLGTERRRELSERARLRAAQFHWERLVPLYLSMYQQALVAREKAAA
ncbi:MAG: glycosyltransferase family 4 protein [Polyangia bacterium]